MPRDSHAHGDTQTVRRIVGELDKLEPDRARYLASFAYVMSRVARADLNVSQVETDKMVEILQRVGGLPEEQALLVVEIAKSQSRIFGGTEDFLVTREFRELATDAQRREALDCLFAVSAADDVITAEEEGQISADRQRARLRARRVHRRPPQVHGQAIRDAPRSELSPGRLQPPRSAAAAGRSGRR